MSNDEKKYQPIFQILHIKSACFLLKLAMALVTTIGMRFLQVWESSLSALYNTVLQKVFCFEKILNNLLQTTK